VCCLSGCAGRWSTEGFAPQVQALALADFDTASAQAFVGRTRVQVQEQLGTEGLHLTPGQIPAGTTTLDPFREPLWTYRLQRRQSRGLFRSEVRQEDRSLQLDFGAGDQVQKVEWNRVLSPWVVPTRRMF